MKTFTRQLSVIAALTLTVLARTGSAQTNTFPSSGNAGVGTTSPTAKLHIISVDDTVAPAVSIRQDSATAYGFDLTLDTNVNGNLSVNRINNGASANLLTFDRAGGNVGIGTTSPATKLELAPNTAIKLGNAYLSSGGDFLHLANNEWYNGTSWVATAAGGLIQISGQDVNFYRHDASGGHTQSMIINSSGNVGIGTTGPNYKFDVNGEINATGFRINGTPISTGPVSSVFGRTGAVVAATNDYTWAQINKSTSSLGDLQTRSAGDLNAGTVPIQRLGLSGTANSTTFLRGDNTWATVTNSQWNTSGSNDIYYNTGNVGIGTLTPTTKLHVVGDVTVTGNIAAKYQDVAEWVPASSALPAGTVVTLDPAKSNHVEASSKAYDTRVAGVISEQPGITLGESGDKKVLVATTGRVVLMVDASNAPIQIGDLLVTSDIRGVAMKSQAIDVGGVRIHRPGTLIGKALEPLETGKGKILVLLSLQ